MGDGPYGRMGAVAGRIREGGPAGLEPQLRIKPEKLWDSNYERQAGWVRVLFPAAKKVMVRKEEFRECGALQQALGEPRLWVSFMPLADRTYPRHGW